MTDYYTNYPRPILWLISEGTVEIDGSPVEVESFYISKFPVTNEQFEAFDPAHVPSPASPGRRDPAVGITWSEAQEYCEWYAEVSNKSIRLPTNAEWEHACRAGSTTRYFWGDDPSEADQYAWTAENTQGVIRALDDRMQANEHGLYGILGGVWEWTAEKVLRGGSFRESLDRCTCGTRYEVDPEESRDDVGFRIVKSLH